MIFLFKGGLSWEKIFDSDSYSKRGIFETKFDIFLNWFSIWFNSSSNFELLNFMWWLYNDAGSDAVDDAGDEFVNMIISYEEFSELYVELFDAYAKLSWDLRNLEELALLNSLLILLIVIENNHNFVLNQFR